MNSITYPTVISKLDKWRCFMDPRLKSDGDIVWYCQVSGGTNNESTTGINLNN